MRNLKATIKSLDLTNVSLGSWRRLIQMFISILMVVCKSIGIIIPSIDDSLSVNIVILVFVIISFLQSYWKNNSFTMAAQVADIYMHKAKEELKNADNSLV